MHNRTARRTKSSDETRRYAGLARGFSSLKFRLMLLITAVLLIVVGLPVALFVYHLDRNNEEFSTTMLEITAGFAYQHIYDGFMMSDSTSIQQAVEYLAGDPSIQLLRIYNPSGQILYSSRPEELQQNVYDLSEMVFFNTAGSQVEAFSKVGNIYAHHHPIYVEEACAGCHEPGGSVIAVMDIHTNLSGSEQIYMYAKQLSITGGILIIIILWILTNLLYQEQIESRLLTFLRGFDKLSEGNLDFKIKMKGRHELALLAERFNATVENLKAAKKKEEDAYLESLERTDRLVTLGEIAAEIAHEVNNPAGIILTRAEYIKEEMEEQDPACQHVQDMGIIVQQTEKIADITRSILHYARKLPREFASTDLNEVLQHAITILGPRIQKFNADVDLQLSETPALVWGSFSQMEQVFCNLINNSLDVMPENNGCIDIDIQPFYRNDGQSMLMITYQDNGPGIQPEIRESIFSPFFTTKKDGKGTGLGLFISKNIISHHNGSIAQDSDFRDGARFVIEMERYHG